MVFPTADLFKDIGIMSWRGVWDFDDDMARGRLAGCPVCATRQGILTVILSHILQYKFPFKNFMRAK